MNLGIFLSDGIGSLDSVSKPLSLEIGSASNTSEVHEDVIEEFNLVLASESHPCRVTTASSGRLGNQMFGFVSLLKVCGKLKAPCCVNNVSKKNADYERKKHLDVIFHLQQIFSTFIHLAVIHALIRRNEF